MSCRTLFLIAAAVAGERQFASVADGNPAAGKPPWYLRPAILLRVVLAATFLVYLRTITFDFVFDDHLQISLNPWLESWRQVPGYFTHQLWAFTDAHTPASFYRPLFMLWLAAVKHLTGGAPGWYHLATIALHLMVVVEAYWLARLLLKDDLGAVLAAALWALHPAKVEAVAWISGGGEPLFAAFFFATLIFYLRARESGRSRLIGLALAFFALALFSKEQAIVAPAILLAYEFWRERLQPLTARARCAVVRIAPFLAVAATFWLIRWRVMRGVTEAAKNLSIPKTLLTQPLAWLWYAKHLCFPFDLSLFYPEMIVRQVSLGRFVLPLIAIVAVAGLLWLVARRSAEGVLLYAWFVCTMAPPVAMVLLLQPHDRYLYLPSFAAAVALAAALRRFIPQPRVQVAVAAVLCAALAVSTFHEARFWDNDVLLMEHAVSHAPDNVEARVILAAAYTQQGEVARGKQILREAARLRPNNMRVWQSLAAQEYSAGEYQQAYEDFKRAVSVAQPGEDGLSLNGLGLICLRLNRPAEAEQWARRAIALDPGAAGYHRSLAAILDAEGRHDEAGRERAMARRIQK
jgi:Tfp pilus assembly protein PilF